MFDLSALYGETVTIINKLDAKHAALRQDVYFPTVLEGCMWSERFESGTSSQGVVTPTTLHRVQIPPSYAYAKYSAWRDLPDKEGTFTLRTGDYIVRGRVTEPLTAESIRTVVADYEPDAFQVRAWTELSTVDDVPEGLRFRFSVEG